MEPPPGSDSMGIKLLVSGLVPVTLGITLHLVLVSIQDPKR
jgi:hypothetical protein